MHTRRTSNYSIPQCAFGEYHIGALGAVSHCAFAKCRIATSSVIAKCTFGVLPNTDPAYCQMHIRRAVKCAFGEYHIGTPGAAPQCAFVKYRIAASGLIAKCTSGAIAKYTFGAFGAIAKCASGTHSARLLNAHPARLLNERSARLLSKPRQWPMPILLSSIPKA